MSGRTMAGLSANDLALQTILSHGGRRYDVVGIVNSPAAIVEEIGTGARSVIVFGSRLAAEYTIVEEPERSYWRGFLDAKRGTHTANDNPTDEALSGSIGEAPGG